MTNEHSAEGNDGSTCASACSDGHAEKKLTSRFRGVCWNRKNKRWQAAINHAGKYIYLGSFQAEEEAAKAFDRAAVKLRGQCAKINFAFSDYPAEMSWHKMLMQKANATDAVLKNPRCLRNKVEMPMDGIRSFMGSLTTPPFLTHPPCNFNVYPFCQTAGHPEPLQGRVIGTQGQQSVNNGVVNPLYYYSRRGDTTVETVQMPCSVYMNGGGEILSTSHPDGFTTPPGHLSAPAVRMQPVAQPVVTRDRTWPVVNVPAEARLTQFFSGPQNAFAMGFVRSEAAPTEVLLYDGRAMHEVGSFSSKDDAAQTCQSLLDILDNINTGNPAQPQYLPERPPPPNGPPADQLPKVHNVEDVEDADPETAITGELKGKSPFELPPGARPSFDLEESEKELVRIPEKFDRPTIELAQSDLKGRTNSAPLDMKSGSLKQRMGSLLHLEPTLSARRLSDISPATPSTSPRGGQKSGSNLKVSSQSLRLSGSLQKLLSGFNQSGILGSIKKEDSEDDAVDTPFPAAALSLSHSPDSPPTSMPAQFLSPVGISPQPHFAFQHSECVSLYMNNGSEHFTPFLKRKPDEMTLQNQVCKKTKANPTTNLS